MPTRARTLGITRGTLPTGPLNAITDVPGVLVGHTTITNGTTLHTGVTAIVPPGFTPNPLTAGGSVDGADGSVDAHAGAEREGEPPGATAAGEGGSAGVAGKALNAGDGSAGGDVGGVGLAGGARPAFPAAVAVGNGYGKLVGSTQVGELGVLETPILLTGTLSVFRVADALVTWLLDRDPSATSLNPVVGETNDGFLSDIRRRPIIPEHVFAALDTATSALPAEGCVGAGTGTAALGFKAGIGTSSRQTSAGTIGVLVQSNFSGTLTVLGTPIPAPKAAGTPGGNSCMIVVATDLALDSRQLGRIARRAVFAMGRVGSDYAPGSGDYAIAFSTATTSTLPESTLNTLFQATIEATEEALLNSLTMAVDTTGYNGNTRHAVPLEALSALVSG